jgi:hypothetical protein
VPHAAEAWAWNLLDREWELPASVGRGLVSEGEAYKGYIIQSDPIPFGARWTVRVVIELHQFDSVHYQEVADDPFRTYETREEANRASMAFGKVLLDSRQPRGSA